MVCPHARGCAETDHITKGEFLWHHATFLSFLRAFRSHPALRHRRTPQHLTTPRPLPPIHQPLVPPRTPGNQTPCPTPSVASATPPPLPRLLMTATRVPPRKQPSRRPKFLHLPRFLRHRSPPSPSTHRHHVPRLPSAANPHWIFLSHRAYLHLSPSHQKFRTASTSSPSFRPCPRRRTCTSTSPSKRHQSSWLHGL